ncbi:MAG: gluconate 2-dehydrogenase gamma chain [Cyclobacteriaceae bacterium]|jgi:gluconate 2-dehydrogenase gamma chain
MGNIDRREALKRATLILGGVITAPTILGVLNGCAPDPKLIWEPSFFTKDQAKLIMELTETILPETDTPGAKSLGVPSFVEQMVSTIYDEKTRSAFMSGLGEMRKEIDAIFGKPFVELNKGQQKEYAKKKNSEIFGMEFSRGVSERPFFWRLKELTLVGYYTSEYGATKALQYLPVPVEYKGCIPLSEAGNGKTWATS